MQPAQFFTPSGVRLRQRAQRNGDLNWLLLPGGPGIGSESLFELADTLDVPGTIWALDLPGDGNNVAPPGMGADPFAKWPQVLLDAAEALPNCVYVGHSTGGMYLLSVPELELCAVGLVLISTAPHSGWHPLYAEMTQRDPLPAVDEAARVFEVEPTNDNLRDIAVASAPWNFTPRTVAAGREFLARMPYNRDAVEWSDRNFDHNYVAAYWSESLPTLILAGAEDRIVAQHFWDSPRFQGANVLRRTVPNAGHFPWLENADDVRMAFEEFSAMVDGTL